MALAPTRSPVPVTVSNAHTIDYNNTYKLEGDRQNLPCTPRNAQRVAYISHLVKERGATHNEGSPGRRIGRLIGVVEGRVECEPRARCNAAVISVEDERLIACHLRVKVPPVARREV